MKRNRCGNRASAGSTPLPESLQWVRDLHLLNSTNSPISGANRKLSFSDPELEESIDNEVIITSQADKRRKMSEKEELQLWFKKEFGQKLDNFFILLFSILSVHTRDTTSAVCK